MKIKICGLRRKEDILYANKYLPDYIGFVFAKSKRQVSAAAARELKSMLDPRVKAVGVFVDEDMENVARTLEEKTIDIVQLHGREDQVYIDKLKKLFPAQIIKAVRVDEKFTMPSFRADYILFDSGSGGTGKTFDWEKIKGCKRPFFLAGGLNAENIKQAAALKPFCLDISGGVETGGVKDEGKIRQIINIIRGENYV